MSAAVWHFLEGPDGGMARIPASQVKAFLDGSLRLGAEGREEVRFVEVLVEIVERRIVVGFHRATARRRKVRPDGTADPEHVRDALRPTLEAIDLLDHLRGDAAEDLGRRHTRRDHARVHSWKPSCEQLRAVALVVNGATRVRPVVKVSADCELVEIRTVRTGEGRVRSR